VQPELQAGNVELSNFYAAECKGNAKGGLTPEGENEENQAGEAAQEVAELAINGKGNKIPSTRIKQRPRVHIKRSRNDTGASRKKDRKSR